MDQDTCSIEWCEKPRRAAGLCGMHYQRKLRGQDMDAPPRQIHSGGEMPYCAVRGCGKRADSRQPLAVCGMHRARMARRGSNLISRIQQRTIGTCTITGCENAYKAAGACNRHYVRLHMYGLSAIQFDMIVRRGRCDSCGDPLTLESIHIDHDHACCPGERSCGTCVRGSLCSPCNVGLGAFGDSPDRLRAAIAYLARV